MPWDTEYRQRLLYRALSVWILRSQALCVCLPPIITPIDWEVSYNQQLETDILVRECFITL